MIENIAHDALGYVAMMSPILFLLGALSMSDVIISVLVNVFKKLPFGEKE